MTVTPLAFAGRWSQIEVRASRYCSGFFSLSLAYVPLIVAWVGPSLGVAELRSKKEPAT